MAVNNLMGASVKLPMRFWKYLYFIIIVYIIKYFKNMTRSAECKTKHLDISIIISTCDKNILWLLV